MEYQLKNRETYIEQLTFLSTVIFTYIMLVLLHELGHFICFILFDIEINHLVVVGFNVFMSEFTYKSEFFIALLAMPFIFNVLYLIASNKSKYWILVVIYLLRGDIILFITKSSQLF